MIGLLRRNVFDPLDAWRIGSPRVKYWKKLEKTQYLSEQAHRSKQLDRLQTLLEVVYNNNDFYRRRFDEAGIKPRDIQTLRDFKHLPLLRKEEVRQNTPKMISNGYTIDKLKKFQTGGSTGKALDIFITEYCSEVRNACCRRHDRWAGWEVGEPVGALWGNPVLPKSPKQKLKHWLLEPWIYLDTIRINEETVRHFEEEWKQIGPTLLFGHAHSIFILAEYLEAMAIKDIKPKGIISTSMMLIPHERRFIEQIFDVPVTDRYGSEEVGLIASECERHEGLHLNIEHLVIEFLNNDGGDAAPGKEGSIVITDLINDAMPFIRYQIEDVGVPSGHECSCGRGMPLMERVVGRVADFLVRRDGSLVAGVSLIERTLLKTNGLNQMQIIQEQLDRIHLNLVRSDKFVLDDEKFLKTELQEVFGRETVIDVDYVESISAEPSGKYRFSICNVER